MHGRFSKTLTMALLATLPFMVTSCDQGGDADTIASAQSCLDSAQTPTDAQTCRAMVNGLTSSDASMIRCSADFLSQGFTGTRIASAFQAMKNNTSGADPAISVMSYLVFTAASPTTTLTVTDCGASGSLALVSLANAASLSTTIASVAAGGLSGFDPTTVSPATLITNIESGISTLSSSPAALASAGQAVLSMQSTLCASGSSVQNQAICTYVNTAIGNAASSSPSDVATALIAVLQTKYTP
jgi:hypothetical protein